MKPRCGSVREQRDAQPVAHVQALLAAHQPAFHRRIEHAHEDAFGRHAGDHRGETSGPRGSCSATAAMRLSMARSHLARGVLSSACSCARWRPVRRRHTAPAGVQRLEQPLRHQVGEAAIGRGGVRVIVRGQAEVALLGRRRAASARTRRGPSVSAPRAKHRGSAPGRPALRRMQEGVERAGIRVRGGSFSP